MSVGVAAAEGGGGGELIQTQHNSYTWKHATTVRQCVCVRKYRDMLIGVSFDSEIAPANSHDLLFTLWGQTPLTRVSGVAFCINMFGRGTRAPQLWVELLKQFGVGVTLKLNCGH